ncbi:NADPH-dependent F420 reductase [Flavobacterium procerum]|uniref:NADPH-dependent F420 reductase n=1 Tax=Flavobacterium procerum TaxID=1455569 RepID=A0ABV6BY59_9FLAO
MKIGIIGAGAIGSVLSKKLSANGHQVTIANSKGPETVSGEALAFGATAGITKEAIIDKDVLIISIPFSQINNIAKTIKENIDERTIIIDTGNYYPVRDGSIDEILEGKPESIWVSEKLGLPVAKAWNSVGAAVLKNNGYPSGMQERLAVPFAAADENSSKVVKQLIEETGFDPYYVGNLQESYRFQPGQPSYSTSLNLAEIKKAIEQAHSSLNAALRREEFIVTMMKLGWPDDAKTMVEISRFLNNK